MIKNSTTVALVLLVNSMLLGQADDFNFPHKVLLTNMQITNTCKSFPSNCV